MGAAGVTLIDDELIFDYAWDPETILVILNTFKTFACVRLTTR
jgi:hypothetical protein